MPHTGEVQQVSASSEVNKIVWWLLGMFAMTAIGLGTFTYTTSSSEARQVKNDFDAYKAANDSRVTGLEHDVKAILGGIERMEKALGTKADAKKPR